jgi:hypothetical protein
MKLWEEIERAQQRIQRAILQRQISPLNCASGEWPLLFTNILFRCRMTLGRAENE